MSRIYAVNDTLPVTLGDDSIEQIVENYDIRMVIIDPIQEYLEYDVYQDPPALIYSVLIKLEKLAKKSGCAVVLMADSEGAGSRQADVWKYEFAGTISSLICLDRLETEKNEITLLHERCMLAQEGKMRMFRLGDLETVLHRPIA